MRVSIDSHKSTNAKSRCERKCWCKMDVQQLNKNARSKISQLMKTPEHIYIQTAMWIYLNVCACISWICWNPYIVSIEAGQHTLPTATPWRLYNICILLLTGRKMRWIYVMGVCVGSETRMMLLFARIFNCGARHMWREMRSKLRLSDASFEPSLKSSHLMWGYISFHKYQYTTTTHFLRFFHIKQHLYIKFQC